MGTKQGMEVFGAGAFYVIGSDGTPRKLAKLQDVALDMQFTTKTLYGDGNLAAIIARGTAKVTGKVTVARFNADVLNEVFFGQTAIDGQLLTASDEAHAIAAGAVVLTHVATFGTDLGVVHAETGVPFKKVTTTPAVGEYSCDAFGSYTFNATDNAVNVLVDYTYTSATGGRRIALQNKPVGTTVTFMGIFTQTFNGKTKTVKLNKLVSSKLSLLATKIEDFTIPNFDFEAMVDDSDSLGEISIAN